MTGRGRWAVVAVVAGLGALAFAVLSGPGPRSALSYLAGLILVVAAFEFGVFNIRLADKYVPHLTMAVALISYATTAVAFGLVLAASRPAVIDGVGMATGLVTGLIVWLGGLLVASRVRTNHG